MLSEHSIMPSVGIEQYEAFVTKTNVLTNVYIKATANKNSITLNDRQKNRFVFIGLKER